MPLFVEYEAVTKRIGLLSNLGHEDVNSILNYILSKSKIQKIFYLWRPLLKDPKDDLVLEVAVVSKSKYILTFNIKDFKGCEKFGIKALTPQEFMKIRGMKIMSTLSLRLPNSLHDEVKLLAKKEGISINQFISSAVGEKM